MATTFVGLVRPPRPVGMHCVVIGAAVGAGGAAAGVGVGRRAAGPVVAVNVCGVVLSS